MKTRKNRKLAEAKKVDHHLYFYNIDTYTRAKHNPQKNNFYKFSIPYKIATFQKNEQLNQKKAPTPLMSHIFDLKKSKCENMQKSARVFYKRQILIFEIGGDKK